MQAGQHFRPVLPLCPHLPLPGDKSALCRCARPKACRAQGEHRQGHSAPPAWPTP